MSWTRFIGAVFVCNVLIGNLCLIGGASAAEAPSPARHKTLMSKRDPTKCPWITQSTGPMDEAAQQSPCATGHCFTQPDPHTKDTAAALQELIPPAIPVSPYAAVLHHETHNPIVCIHNHSPPIPVDIATIVLRI